MSEIGARITLSSNFRAEGLVPGIEAIRQIMRLTAHWEKSNQRPRNISRRLARPELGSRTGVNI
jgi:3'-phosphoadenosine 5'-phosphosulfate sulfotransferase